MGGTHEIVFRVYPIHTLRAWENTWEEKKVVWDNIWSGNSEGATVKTLPAVDKRWRACELAHLPLRTCKLKWCYLQQLKENSLLWQLAGAGKLASLPSHFYPQLHCVCARCPCDSWFQCAHGASALKWYYPQPPETNGLFMTGKLASFPSHFYIFYPQVRCVCARCPCDLWIQCAHGAGALKWCYLQQPEGNNWNFQPPLASLHPNFQPRLASLHANFQPRLASLHANFQLHVPNYLKIRWHVYLKNYLIR